MAYTPEQAAYWQALINEINTKEAQIDFMTSQLTPSKVCYVDMVYEDIDMSIQHIPCRCRIDKFCEHCG